MALAHPIPPLVHSGDEVQQLQTLARSRSLPHSIVQRAQIELAEQLAEQRSSWFSLVA